MKIHYLIIGCLITVYSNIFAQNISTIGSSLITINNYELFVSKRNMNGTLTTPAPYTIKGVCWSPASKTTNTSPTDPNNANTRRPEFLKWYQNDIPLLREMNVNTIRTYIDFGITDSSLLILDELYCNDIMVIMTVDDAINDTARVRAAVNFYKDHPAILMWMIGNEWNINKYYNSNNSLANAIQRTETAASLIQSIDNLHPVATSYGEIDIDDNGLRLADTDNYVNNLCPSVDIWGLNIYRGNSFNNLFAEWQSISTKPIFISEFGTDVFSMDSCANSSGIINEVRQAQWDLDLWNEITSQLSAQNPNNVSLGGTFFSFNDEWWKGGTYNLLDTLSGFCFNPHPDGYANEEMFGIVDIDRTKRAVFDSLQIAFAQISQLSSQQDSLKIISTGANSPLFVQNNSTHFYKNGIKFFTGSRGLNIAVLDSNYNIINTENFDTWGTRGTGADMTNFNNFIDTIPNGRILMIAIHDEGGFTTFNTCNHLTNSWVDSCKSRLQQLGSTMINNYCYRGSWSMITIKGEGIALGEQLENTGTAITQFGTVSSPVLAAYSPLAPLIISPLTNTILTNNSIQLNWSIVNNANSYQLQISTDSTFNTMVIDSNFTNTSFLFNGNYNETYYWWIKAINTTGDSSRWSCSSYFRMMNCTNDTTYINVTSCDIVDIGTITNTLQNQGGCDSLVITNTTLLQSSQTNLNANSCDSSQVGIDTLVLQNQGGCDSLVITNTTLLQSSQINLNATSCDFSQVGIDTLVLQNQGGCDSLVITNTTLLQSSQTNLNATSCDSSQVGIDTLVLQNQGGCDSLVITNTTLLQSSQTNLNANSCDSSQVGIDTLVLQNQGGCDSLIITNTTLLQSSQINLNANSCDSSQVGIDTLVLQNQGGCDSLVITNTTLLQSSQINLNANSCDSSQVGIDTLVLQNQGGCDSLVITNTTLLQSSQTNLNFMVCDVNQVSIDTLILQSQSGCDSLVINNYILNDFSIDSTSVINTPCGLTNGSITVSVSGGATPYHYLWSNGDTTATIDSLITGNYTVTVTDGNNCSRSTTRFIALSNPMAISFNANDALCFQEASGMIQTTVNGGTSPLSYNWSNGDTTANLSNLLAGNYLVTITEAYGCFQIGAISISEPSKLDIVSFQQVQPSSCNATDGGLSVFPAGAIPPYTYLWSNGDTNQIANNLSIGDYTVTVMDANGCSISSSLIELNSPIGVTPIAEIDISVIDFETVEFINNSQNGNSYLWDFGDGNTLTTTSDTNVIHNYNSSDTFTVSLTVYSQDSCVDTDSMILDIIHTSRKDIDPIVFDAIIFPNPNNGQFQLKVKDLPIGEWQVNIHNITGQLMQSETQNFHQANMQIPITLRDISGGMYYLKMMNKEGLIITRRFIVN